MSRAGGGGHGTLRLGTGGRALLVFLPGFMLAPAAYRAVLQPAAAAGARVVVPGLYRRGPSALRGRPTPAEEAQRAVAVLREEAAALPGAPVVLAGHSRGGQAAWRAAGLLAAAGAPAPLPAGVVLVDPVDGEGRDPSGPTSTAEPTAWRGRTLIVGAGIGGRCAPAAVNHAVFAAAAPWAEHVVVDAMGHADLLDGPRRALGRLVCPGGTDPDAARAACAALLAGFIG